ncbi:hypothetical protein KP509_1Z142500 [Ceratopteris richardii]|nr:hypothetical protein KP509_1Z142500 [Ceratopteris richardii]
MENVSCPSVPLVPGKALLGGVLTLPYLSLHTRRFAHCHCRQKLATWAKASLDEVDRAQRQKALDAAIADINSSFGRGSVIRLGSTGGALVETFPSGCITLDLALGGGLPKGRIIEVFGPESSGKTTLALHAIAQIQNF